MPANSRFDSPVLSVFLPEPKAALVGPDLRAGIRSHARDVFPRDRTIQQAHVAAFGANGGGCLLVGLRVGLEVNLLPNDRSTSSVRSENSLKAVGVNVEIGHQHQGRVLGRFLR